MSTPFSFFELFPLTDRVEIVDVGASPIEGTQEVYAPLVARTSARITGFEPDAAGRAKAEALRSAPHRFLPHFVGKGGPATFHETSDPLTGSLYAPNADVLAFYPDVAPHVQLRARHSVETKRLDDIAEISRIDFLKMDVQGAELDVLHGATRLLKDILVVQAEVEFVPLYQGQPLFSDVDAFMRAQGFQFHTFVGGLANRFVRPIRTAGPKWHGLNQVLWADAVYMRDLAIIPTLPPARQLMMAALMHELYSSVDVSLHIVHLLAQQGYVTNLDDYVRRVTALFNA